MRLRESEREGGHRGAHALQGTNASRRCCSFHVRASHAQGGANGGSQGGGQKFKADYNLQYLARILGMDFSWQEINFC